MAEVKRRAFVNHVHNGVNLKFTNGNALSTIWGYGSYTENHTVGENDKLNPIGSDTCEIMIDSQDSELVKKIYRRLNAGETESVIGHLTMEQWLWVVKELSDDRGMVK